MKEQDGLVLNVMALSVFIKDIVIVDIKSNGSSAYPPNSVNLVCPKGMRRLNAFPSHVILTSFLECSMFMVYPSFTNRSIKSGSWRELIRWFMAITS